jgi:glycosyltransferase involved in cell wall biosynthesis
MGVTESKLRWVRLGQPHFDQINRKARRSPFYDLRPWDLATATRPLRFGFYGTVRNNKGLEVLLQAIPLLQTVIRQRCQFIIRALGWDWPLRKRLSAYPEVSFAGGYDLLQLIASAGDYDVGVLPHIWFENSPLVMLEHLHAGKFVIASRLGGPADFITPEKNGLLFAAGRPDELAACITCVVKGEVVLPSPREIHQASLLQSYPAHVMEVQGIYRELLERMGSLPAPGTTTATPLGARHPAFSTS